MNFLTAKADQLENFHFFQKFIKTIFHTVFAYHKQSFSTLLTQSTQDSSKSTLHILHGPRAQPEKYFEIII